LAPTMWEGDLGEGVCHCYIISRGNIRVGKTCYITLYGEGGVKIGIFVI